jgi:hypothetical protein
LSEAFPCWPPRWRRDFAGVLVVAGGGPCRGLRERARAGPMPVCWCCRVAGGAGGGCRWWGWLSRVWGAGPLVCVAGGGVLVVC